MIKGVCILLIIITHYSWSAEERLRYLFPFWIDMAVPVFMVITGYVSSASFERKQTTLGAAYRFKAVLIKWLRFIVPFFPAWLLSVLCMSLTTHHSYTGGSLVVSFLTGGHGPGSYYTPVMLQVVLLLPLIWYLVIIHGFKGMCACFILNVIYEAVKTVLHMSPSVYRLCALRYIFVLAYGCWLYYGSREAKERKWYYLTGALGLTYIVLCNYTALQPIITAQWTTTSVFAAFFIVPIMMVLIDQTGWHNRMLEMLGKATFNIFLAQMVYYLGACSIVYRLVPSVVLRIVVNMVICCVAGIVFWKIESPLTKRIVDTIRG